ncbi:MAG: transcriptional regulator [Propionibacteriaceae bacterium]|jgi:Mn-dependent DtxR family transcriptional regulator|nr:transcriptional regulator [Propionibacteriaceae bacterium]
MATKEDVLAAFAASDVPLKAGQVAESLGVEKKLVDKAIKELKAEGKIISPKNCFYQAA